MKVIRYYVYIRVYLHNIRFEFGGLTEVNDDMGKVYEKMMFKTGREKTTTTKHTSKYTYIYTYFTRIHTQSHLHVHEHATERIYIHNKYTLWPLILTKW